MEHYNYGGLEDEEFLEAQNQLHHYNDGYIYGVDDTTNVNLEHPISTTDVQYASEDGNLKEENKAGEGVDELTTEEMIQKLNIETEQLQNVEEIVKNEFETVEGVQENVALKNDNLTTTTPTNNLITLMATETNYIVYNTFAKGEWGKEERKSNPYKKGDDIDIRIRAHDSKFTIFADQKEIKEYEHRVPLSSVTHFSIDGDILVTHIHWGGKYYPVPYESGIVGEGFAPGKTMLIFGTPEKKGKRFHINLLRKNGDIALHFNPRFDEKAIVRNSLIANEWGNEEREGKLPLEKGIGFDLKIVNEEYAFQIFLNEERFCSYAHRMGSLETVVAAALEDEERRRQLSYKKIKKEALAPVFGSEGAAGADLHSAEECVVPAKGKYLVPTGIQIALPEGCYGRIAPRSGLASKNFIDVGAGVIDPDYRGELKVLLFNFSDADFKISVGDRIAQLVCTPPALVEVTNLDETDRGDNGFGSTGSLSKEAIESISDGAVLKSRIAIIDGTLVVVALIVILFAVLLFFIDKWGKDADPKVTQTTNPIVINQHFRNNSPQQNIDRNEGDGDIQEVVVQSSKKINTKVTDPSMTTQGSHDSNKNELPSSSQIGTNDDQIKMLEEGVQFKKSIQQETVQTEDKTD
uniref:Galectin domain-containing protein n=1 Tax=Meloidogyne javanica TaxID=6303 RepID=A0A915N872_MELJA